MKILIKRLWAMAALPMLLVAGCGGEGGDADTFPANSMEINGTISPITEVTIWYAGAWRYLVLENANGDSVELDFEDSTLGDPVDPASHYPRGTWTAMDTTFYRVHIVDSGVHSEHESDSTYSGSLVIGGTPGSTVRVNATLEFTTEPTDTIRVKYSGAYEYEQD